MHYRNQIHEKIYTAKVRNNPYHCSNSYPVVRRFVIRKVAIQKKLYSSQCYEM